MSKLSFLWDRPIIQCAYKMQPCGLGFFADNAPGDLTPPLFVCAAGFNVRLGAHHHDKCKRSCVTSRSRPRKPGTKAKKRSIGPKRRPSVPKAKPLWMVRGDMGCYV